MTETTSPESPTPLDVFEESLMSLDAEHFDGWVIVEYPFPEGMSDFEKDEIYEEAHTLCQVSKALEDGDPSDWRRCFVGNAVVVAPQLTGSALRWIGYYGPGYSAIADHYSVREQLVHYIGEGVVGMPFGGAKRFARACILAEREALAEGRYPAYPSPRDFEKPEQPGD